MNDVILGAISMGFGLASLFFLRFWSETRDRLFLFIAVAFAVLAANRVMFAFYKQDDIAFLYGVRFAAYALILIGILDKNRATAKPE